MTHRNRREFLNDVGQGMLVATLGATAFELGLAPNASAAEESPRLTFGELEPLVSLMQETPPESLQPKLIGALNSGTSLAQLVRAGALANARAFGGQDYTGFHTFMALLPAWHMAAELPAARQALPVLKVLYRNSSRIQSEDADEHDVLHPVSGAKLARGEHVLRDEIREIDWNGAESQFAALIEQSPVEAFEQLQLAVQDEINVHRTVLAWRAWAMRDLVGEQYAHTLLRQSVRFCLDSEQEMKSRDRAPSAIRDVLPRLLEDHKLLARNFGNRRASDAEIDELAQAIFTGTREQAAEAVAIALADGMHPESVGEAMSVAANRLVLHDPGRKGRYSSPEKPPGCVHGDSVGVHASDAANAWRNLSRISSQRNRAASLIVGAYHTAGQFAQVTQEPYPYGQFLDEASASDPGQLLGQAEEAIRGNDQARACAVIDRYGKLNLPARPVFDLLLKYAISEDGALHAEKYYRTVSEEFNSLRPAFRWQQVIGLARVTASEYGYPAPGYEEACGQLGIS